MERNDFLELSMLLRPRTLTPASLAARPANALKSTGPRTERGKAAVALNPRKRRRFEDRSRRELVLVLGSKPAATVRSKAKNSFRIRQQRDETLEPHRKPLRRQEQEGAPLDASVTWP
jgi:hypothetical protein